MLELLEEVEEEDYIVEVDDITEAVGDFNNLLFFINIYFFGGYKVFCIHPNYFNGTLVPCGKCVNCRKRRINDWTIKVLLESQYYNNNSLFCTLTYNDDNLPDGSLLDYSDFQKFMKRLRKKISDVRYFCCEEYGSRFGRPHFHCILFNVSYTSENVELVDKCWNKGFTKILPMKPQNARYISKYCVKQFQKVKKFEIDGQIIEKREKIHWSSGRVGGLGWRYFYSHLSDYFFESKIKFSGFNFSIPRCFRQKLDKLTFLKKIYNKFFSQPRVVNILSYNNEYSQFCSILSNLRGFQFEYSPDIRDGDYIFTHFFNQIIRCIRSKIDFSFFSDLKNFFSGFINFFISLVHRYDEDVFQRNKLKYYGANVYVDSFNYLLSHFDFRFSNFSNFQNVLDINRRHSIDYCHQHRFDFYDYEKQYFSNNITYYQQLLVDFDYLVF